MNLGAQIFTAAQIARALGKTRQTVAQALVNIAPAGTTMASGNAANAWRFVDLPYSTREELSRRAQRQGYRDAEHLLSAPTLPWEPRVPLASCLPADREKAERLCRVFANHIQRLDARPVLSSGELERMGTEDYRREFGHGISERRWRNLWQRTLDRDRGQDRFDRVELYLDENARRADDALVTTANAWEALLGDYLSQNVVDGDLPTNKKEWVWQQACKRLAEHAERPATQLRLRQELVQFLALRIPGLASSQDSLRKQISYKLKGYVEQGAKSIQDKRRTAFRPKKKYTDEELLPLLVPTMCQTEGACLSEGSRMSMRGGDMPESIRSAIANPLSKSHVKTSVRQQVAPLAKAMLPFHRGMKPGDRPPKDRLHDMTGAGHWFSADDVTLPVYVLMPDENGEMCLSRGQFIMMVDDATMRVLGSVFILSRNYNSLAIRSLMTRVCSSYGLPEKGFYFEQALWKSSRMIHGRPGKGPVGFEDIEVAFGSFADIQFDHATSPCAKVVEIVNKKVQRLMAGQRGYCGPAERDIRYLQNEKRMVEAKTGKAVADQWFYHAEKWEAVIQTLIEEYNAEPQQGDILKGFSPNEAWERFRDPESQRILLPPHLRYLLSHHQIPVKVTFKGGVMFNVGKETYRYMGTATSPYINQVVVAWFDPENPDQIVITERDGTNPQIVDRMKKLHPHEATPEELAEENRKINGHISRPKALYSVVKNSFEEKYRSFLPNAIEDEKGHEFKAAIESSARETKAKDSERQKLDSLARRTGLKRGAAALSSRATEEGLEALEAFLNEDLSESEGSNK